MWRPLRDTMKKIVKKNCDAREAEEINKKLDEVSPYCVCECDDDRINQMVKFLEDEVQNTKDIFEWFIKVLRDDDIKSNKTLNDHTRKQLIRDIQEKLREISPYGPVNKK